MGEREFSAYFSELSLPGPKMDSASSLPPESDSSTTSKPTFPPEILDLIWNATLDLTPRRVVEITSDVSKGYRIFSHKTAITPRLHVCRRSRVLSLRRYKLYFGNTHIQSRPMILFNPERDVLILGRLDANAEEIAEGLSMFTTEAERETLKTIAIHIDHDLLGEIAADGAHAFAEAPRLADCLKDNFPLRPKVIFLVEGLSEFMWQWRLEGGRNVWAHLPITTTRVELSFCSLMRQVKVRWYL